MFFGRMPVVVVAAAAASVLFPGFVDFLYFAHARVLGIFRVCFRFLSTNRHILYRMYEIIIKY